MKSPPNIRLPETWLRLPHAEAGNRIGLFGGSFNPPHSGHRQVAETALKRAGLDQVWWLVTPGNPLKDHGNLAPLESRIDAVARLAAHPRMRVTAFEATLGTSYTASVIATLRRLRPALRFVWIMGADSLASFHRWQRWKSIAEGVPMLVVDRPGASMAALSAPAAQTYAGARIEESDADLLPFLRPPAWTFVTTRLDPSSSTKLREGH
ncbi:nicotinate-nucleotide adenylyltransferase [Stappia sp. F7233]|uniref:Probable nicotinate-nucleotide adenylyltransferase n=1 Tax=Stappia albiluteola TaxID=2758565 RepID=A0A839AD47_9HYPH|nr:nicotinate-nucleotide adenylyltransferase [Stappia albiluteola]MBA5777045.1 nicotinate-nucleotide adenylyltransferase [Stappia albiluteola]